MNKNDKLQKSLKKAFEEHHEPLHEAQWERLNAALDEKPRRRFIPWFYAIGVIVMLFLAFATGYYFNSSNKQQPSIVVNEQPSIETPISSDGTTIEKTTQKTETDTKTTANTSTNNTATPSDNSRPTTDKHKINTATTNSSTPIKPATKPTTSQPDNNPVTQPTNTDLATDNINNKTQKAVTGIAEKPLDNISEKVAEKGPESTPGDNQPKGITDDNNAEKIKEASDTSAKTILADANSTTKKANDDSKKKPGKKGKDDSVKVRKKFAFTLASGISVDKPAISKFDKPNNMHKDSRKVFEESNSNNQSLFINLGFEWHPSRRLSLIFNSGIQYREFTAIENTNYELKEAPFRATDGSISFYIPTSIPLVFTNYSTLKTKFVNVPLRFGYTFSLHPKHDLVPTLGANISKITGVEGNTFSLNDMEVRPLKDYISKKINVGLIAGMQYNYNIYKPLWLGLEVQWQQNVYHYNTRYGSMSGKFNTYNYNMILKYKF